MFEIAVHSNFLGQKDSFTVSSALGRLAPLRYDSVQERKVRISEMIRSEIRAKTVKERREGKGPTMSIPHWKKGHGLSMLMRSVWGTRRMGACNWQTGHF